MNQSSQALNDRLRGLLAAAVVVFAFATVFMHVAPADAAETKYLPVVFERIPVAQLSPPTASPSRSRSRRSPTTTSVPRSTAAPRSTS